MHVKKKKRIKIGRLREERSVSRITKKGYTSSYLPFV